MKTIVLGIIINFASSFILLFLGILYLKYKRPQIRIHRYIAEYRSKERTEYRFKIVNFSKMQEAKHLSVKLRGVEVKQRTFNVFIPVYTEIPLSNVSTLIQLDRKRRYSLIKCVKSNDYSYGASYLIMTYESLETLLKNKYSYLQLVVQYTNTNNNELTVKQKFTMEEIKPGHHTNDDDIINMPVNEPIKSYYIAYGSNLNRGQMKERCPDSKIIGSAVLRGYKLLFRSHRNREEGYLTVEKNKRSKVPVGIYQISENDEKKLDIFEGVDTHDYKKERIAIKYKGNYIAGLIYTMVDSKTGKPRDEYYNRVKTGYDEWKFDVSYLKNACNECGYSRYRQNTIEN
jgi:gamma-glutamylcyclotransferase (GGCT)/AIG2-like uncharacterized protein YtfP